MPAADLSAKLGKLTLSNPLVLCSGIVDLNVNLWVRHAREAGAITTKSCCLKPREGHRNPVSFEIDRNIVMNAIGLSNPGAEYVAREIAEYRERSKTPLVASIFGKSMEEFGEVAQIIDGAKPDIIEVDASCPNVDGMMFAKDAEQTARITETVKAKTRIPVFIKLSPNVTDIVSIAKAAVNAGADGITAINTLAGMAIDPVARRPILTNKFGGVSGRAIKPVSIRAVYLIRKALPEIPIIGMGGISCGEDAAEMLVAGANAVGIGTAVIYRTEPFREIKAELADFMLRNGHKSLSTLKLQD